jgi:hypothetical protein
MTRPPRYRLSDAEKERPPLEERATCPPSYEINAPAAPAEEPKSPEIAVIGGLHLSVTCIPFSAFETTVSPAPPPSQRRRHDPVATVAVS